MCKTRRHNVKKRKFDRITSLFISVNMQRNIKYVSLLEQENKIPYISQEKKMVCCKV